MTKQEKAMWGLFAGLLIFLFLLSSTDLIIKEKKTEVYPVSIIISDTTDENYVNFRKGVEQAAAEYHVDISFITLFEWGNAEHQMSLVRREIEDGAAAVILDPVDAAGCLGLLEEVNLGRPLIIMGPLLPNEQVQSGVGIDLHEAGKRLGEAIVQENPSTLPIYLFTEKLEVGYRRELYEGLLSVLSEQGRETVLCEKRTENTYQKVIEGTVYPGSGMAVIAALDADSTAEAASIIGGSPVYGNYIAGLYGIGTAPSLLNQLDQGVIRGILVSNQFDEGYLCVKKAVEAIQKKGIRESIVLESHYIEKEQLQERQYERILYPID